MPTLIQSPSSELNDVSVEVPIASKDAKVNSTSDADFSTMPNEAVASEIVAQAEEGSLDNVAQESQSGTNSVLVADVIVEEESIKNDLVAKKSDDADMPMESEPSEITLPAQDGAVEERESESSKRPLEVEELPDAKIQKTEAQ